MFLFAYRDLLEWSYDAGGNMVDANDLSAQAEEKRNWLSAEEFHEQEDARFFKDGNKWVQERFQREKQEK